MKQSYFDLYKNCSLCPRSCGIDRTVKKGFCGETSDLSINAYLLHKGEEPCISHKNGSGTIFFTGCSLKCPFCQNKQISQLAVKKKYYGIDQFIGIITELINNGAENINFVTPDQFMPHIIEAIEYFKRKKINIPFIYNSSGYQSLEHLKKTIDFIDIFLIDYKFADEVASNYCINNREYPSVAYNAIKYLLEKKGNLILNSKGKAEKGLLIRHLIMPTFIDNSIKVINNLYFDFGNKVYLSLMSQYTPFYLNDNLLKINRRINKKEYDEVINLVNELGFKNGYIQEFINTDDDYLPDFKRVNIFKQK
ncbi:MAG: radical SAM protein [Spirochaetes bacterium]|nr:radical SAM protein [Spirochaetota bacterium]